MDKSLREQFQNPGADMRSIPFWAWNGKMDEEELRNQVRQMKQAGVGGFFIHSRVGLETDYLGEEWMNCVKAVVAEAKEQGLYAWLYDEDRWPSGTAGGRVTSCGDAYRCKGLTLEVLSRSDYARVYQEEIQGRERFTDEELGPVAVYRAVLGDGEPSMSITDFWRVALADGETGLPDGKAGTLKEEMRLPDEGAEIPYGSLAEKEVFLVVRLAVSAPSEWFNHEAPPDNLNPDCVRKFIQETHEKYKEAVGEEFGKTIPGIFTDEPSLNDRFSYFGETKSWIPWTYGFGAYFQERAGYDFFEVLPLFYFHGEDSAKVRHDYWRCIAQRYGESYFKVLGEWCQENHLLFTGHFLQEDKMGLSTRVNGAIMPNYQYQHVPGIDMLCEQTNEYLTVKQCTSVAHQLGKKQVLSETYGCTGWEFTFEGQKWMGDWQYVLGVNRRCQHLMLYSLRGCRKRDYPPCFNYNTNWWQENKLVDDYFARLSVVLEQGEAVRKILLLHPVSTVWSRLGVNPYGNPVRRKERDTPELNAYGDRVNDLIEYLERQHLDCDLGDELLIEKYGSVAMGSSLSMAREAGTEAVNIQGDGRLQEESQASVRFIIGKAEYQAVVLPPMDTLLASTCRKLLDYMDQGGYVYVLESCPGMVEGSQAKKELMDKLLTHPHWLLIDSKEELAEKLTPYRTIRIEEKAGCECGDILYQLRKSGKDYYLFLVNNSRSREADVVVKLPFQAEAIAMDPLTGEIAPQDCCENGVEGMRMPLHLDKAGSAVFYLQTMETRSMRYSGPFAYQLDHKNVLPLDMCRYRMEDGEWSEEQEIWQAQKAIREALEMRPIYHNGTEQRYKWIHTPHPKDGCRIDLAFTFTADRSFLGAALAMERPEDFSVTLNHRSVDWQDAGWLLDKEIRKCILPEICAGENQLILSCCYRNDMELENIYLEGDFAVTPKRVLTELPGTLSVGSWTEQGLKHYCGSVAYQMVYISGAECASRKQWLKLPRISAVCVKVSINEQEITLPWNYEKDISIEKWIHPGKNVIQVEVVGSPRNMMGPFHLKEKPYNTHDASFTPSEEEYSREYLLEPYGLLGEIVIVEGASYGTR